MRLRVAWIGYFELIVAVFCAIAPARGDESTATLTRIAKPLPPVKTANGADILNEAVAAAREIPDRGRSASALFEIANMFHQIGNRPAATALEAEAKRIAPRVKVTGSTRVGVAGIVRGDEVPPSGEQIQSEKETEAADRINEAISEAILVKVQTKLKCREIESALATCAEFDNEDARHEGLLEVAVAMARSREVEAALDVVTKIKRDSVRSYGLVLMTEALLFSRDVTSAKRIQSRIDVPQDKVTALCRIAELQIYLKDTGAAKGTFLEAKRIANAAALTDAEVLEDLIVLQAQLGEINEALAAIGPNLPVIRDAIVAKIVRGLALSGQVVEAVRVLESIKDEFALAYSLYAVAIGQAMTNDFPVALQTAKRLTEPEYRVRTLLEIATCQIEADDRDGAKSTLLLAVEDAAAIAVHPALRELVDSESNAIINLEDMGIQSKYELMLKAGVAQAKGGDVAAAKQTFRRVLNASEAYQDRLELRASLIFDVAEAESRSGLPSEAADWGRKLPSPILRESALRGVAQGLISKRDEPEVHIDRRRADPSRRQPF